MRIRHTRFRRKWPRLYRTTTEKTLAVGEGASENGQKEPTRSLIMKSLPEGKPKPGAKGAGLLTLFTERV